MTQTQPRHFAITEDQIALVVTECYAAIHQHPGLGPVFAAHVTDWTTHKTKIAGFWRNAFLMQRSYDGTAQSGLPALR